jgi:transcriptional regulator with XRE-family HTH domain
VATHADPPDDPLHDAAAEVGAFIRQQREVARMSIRKLADVAGVSNPYLSQIERGLRRPSAEILQQVADALRISVESLYVRAGFLRDEDHRSGGVIEAIAHDPVLSDEQKRALTDVYRSFVDSSLAARPAADHAASDDGGAGHGG